MQSITPPISSGARSTAWLTNASGEVFPIDSRVFTIGRTGSRDLLLRGEFVSGSHAIIEHQEDGSHTLTDVRSRNGTYLNDRRITAPTQLVNGDLIKIGGHEITYCCIHERKTAASGGTTAIHVYRGLAWVFVADLIGFSTRRQQLGAERADALVREWITPLLQLVARHGGVLNSQAGDALLFYWKASGDDWLPRVCAEISELQSAWSSRAPFRVVCHFGEVQVSTDASRNELLSGPDIDFTFRLEKGAKELGSTFALSEAAGLRAKERVAVSQIGVVELASFPGRHAIYGMRSERPALI